MANKAISELPQAQNVNNQDLFVLEQSGIAKKLTAETFITEQGIIDALAEALDGHGGIQSVTLASVSGRIRTYRITFTDQSATTFQVYDGTSIDRISRTSSSGLDDVYTIFLSDGTTTFFTVHNGADGNVSEAMLNDALKDKAPAITETTESSAIANFTDGADDMVIQSLVAEIEPIQDLTYGDPYPAGGGVNKFDESVFSNYGGVLQTSGVWHFDSLVNVLNKVLWTAPESIGQLTVTMWRKQSGVGSQGLRLVINYTDGTSVKVGDQNATGGTDVYSATTDASKTVRNIAGDYGSNQNSTDVNVVVSIGSTAPSAYSPYSNICPITGWTGCNVTRTGVNIWDEEWENGYIDASGVLYAYVNAIRSKNYCACKPNTTYYFKRPSGMTGHGVAWYTADKQFINRIANTFIVTAPNDAYFFKMSLYNYKSDGKTEYLHDISLNYPSTDTVYHEGHIQSIPINWESEAGTVYGGTIDVATGLLTVTNKKVAFNDLTWVKEGTYFFANTGDGYLANSTQEKIRAISSIYRSESQATGGASSSLDVIYPMATIPRRILARPSGYADLDVASWLANVGTETIVYELATPQTYQLTPQEVIKTLLGTNNVWTDIGNVSVTYPADTKMFIEKLTMPTEDDLVANQAITSGKYFMVGNSLYLALANIASGAQITIGTNAQRVSLADALNTINS